MTSSLKLVTEQFPAMGEGFLLLFERDRIFRELCQDYEACAMALDRYASDETLHSEYGALRLRLETELLGYPHEGDERRARKE